MDRQAIYDKVRAHLLAQDAPALRFSEVTSGETMCLYLDAQGRKCAIGCLIPDGHPAQQLLGDVFELLNTYPDLAELWGVEEDRGDFEYNEDAMFLHQLQQVHDRVPDQYSSATHWGPRGLNAAGREALDGIALEEGLTIEPGGWNA